MQFGQMALKFMSSGLMSFGQTPTGLFREDVIEIYVIWTVLHWALVQCHSGRCCWHLTSGHLQHTLNLKADSTFLSKRPPLKLFFLLMAAAIEFPVSKKKRGSAKTCKKAAERERVYAFSRNRIPQLDPKILDRVPLWSGRRWKCWKNEKNINHSTAKARSASFTWLPSLFCRCRQCDQTLE